MKANTILFEIAWEICNQIGGIFTFITSKAPSMMDSWGCNYFLIGPYFPENVSPDFKPVQILDGSPLSLAIRQMRNMGYEVHYGYWLLENGHPQVILINPARGMRHVDSLYETLKQENDVESDLSDQLLKQVLSFGELTRIFFTEYNRFKDKDQDVIAHFHEWMTAAGLPALIESDTPIATTFTTHATLLARYLAPNEPYFYDRLSVLNWKSKAQEYGIEIPVVIERNAAQKAHVLTTVSGGVAEECSVFLGRNPDQVIHNGLTDRPRNRHETSQLQRKSRQQLDHFVKGHFAPSYPVNTDRCLYFFTSGRFEFRNKGYDITLEALARLNARLREEDIDINVVMFMIIKRPFTSLKPTVLESRARYIDLKKLCNTISTQLGPKIYANVTSHGNARLPDINALIDEDLLYKWRQSLESFKSKEFPDFVTHQLVEDDEITRFCERAGLTNHSNDRVKMIYHPDFIERARSIFGVDYADFTRGCNLGIFPGFYEPWGYTSMESANRGVPTVTSNTSGYGQYILDTYKNPKENELYILNRRNQSDEESTQELADILFEFSATYAREQYISRVSFSEEKNKPLCWSTQQPQYQDVYKLALIRNQPESNLY